MYVASKHWRAQQQRPSVRPTGVDVENRTGALPRVDCRTCLAETRRCRPWTGILSLALKEGMLQKAQKDNDPSAQFPATTSKRPDKSSGFWDAEGERTDGGVRQAGGAMDGQAASLSGLPACCLATSRSFSLGEGGANQAVSFRESHVSSGARGLDLVRRSRRRQPEEKCDKQSRKVAETSRLSHMCTPF
jgi:hypothetical protein